MLTRLFLLVFIVFTSSPASADSFSDQLKELFELTQVRNDYIRLNSLIVNQMQAGFFRSAQQGIDGSKFTEEQKEQVREVMKERFKGMVDKYKSHIDDVMPYEKVEDEVFIPLFKEAYTEEDVKELIKFYKSPVGKKSVKVNSTISQQISERAAEKFDPVVVSFIEDQIEENVELVKKDLQDKGIL